MIYKQRAWKFLPIPLFVLFTAVLAACGTATTATSGSSTASTGTPTTTTACLSVATGTIQSVNGTSLQLTSMQGKNVQVIVTSKTTVIRQETLKPADIKVGSPVSVIVGQNSDNTYSALAVNVRTSLTGTRRGGFGNGVSPCNGRRSGGRGLPGSGAGGFGAGNGQSRQTINGTISQASASSLTVTDTSGNDFTAAITAKTRISTQQAVTASDLHSGEAVTIIGSANSQGIITANSVSLLQALPSIRFATPTPAASGA